MPKKLTIIGVLAALVLGIVGLAQRNAEAYNAQSFCAPSRCTGGASAVDVTLCYGGADPTVLGTCGAGSSPDTIADADEGSAIMNYTQITIPKGSRLTLPATYTPGTWGVTTPATCVNDELGAVGCGSSQTGDVTAVTDVFCNGVNDVLAKASTGSGAGESPAVWPGGLWAGEGYPFYRTRGAADEAALAADPENGYVLSNQPMPMSFPFKSLDKARLLFLFTGGFTALNLFLLNDSHATPLQLLARDSAYASPDGVTLSVAMLAGSPAPPTASYLCLQSPQNSVTSNDTLVVPAADGLYPRWVDLQSDLDFVDGSVNRIVFFNCVKVGSTLPTDADGDCRDDSLESASDSGTSTAVTATTLEDTTKTWTTDQWAGDTVTRGGVSAVVVSNTGTELTLAAWSGATPANGAYTIDGTDPAKTDTDGDGLPDGLEAANGSSGSKADLDADGANDFTELFQFTDPNDSDTDGDGRLDKQNNLAGFNKAAPYYNQAATSDNCPAKANNSGTTETGTSTAVTGPLNGLLSTGVTATTLTDTTKTWAVDQWKGATVSSGVVVAVITSNTATVLTFTGGWKFPGGWSGDPPALGTYKIGSSLTKTGAGWTVNTHVGSVVTAGAGTASAVVLSNTADVLTLTAWSDTTPANASAYKIWSASGDFQLNTDSKPDRTLTPSSGFSDVTNPHQDVNGDACDTDDDNDGVNDVAESGFGLTIALPTLPVSGPHQAFCHQDKPSNVLLATTVLDPLDSDFDNDGALDGAECQFESNPTSATGTGARFVNATGSGALNQDYPDLDLLFNPSGGNAEAENLYHTTNIQLGTATCPVVVAGACSGTLLQDIDGDTKLGDADGDADNDGMPDGAEVKFYGTQPSNADTDGDGCKDGVEAADINGDRLVNATDLQQVAARFGVYREADTTGTLSTAVTATTLTDSAKTWTVNAWVGRTLTSGASSAVITSNTATVLTFTGGWTGGTPALGAYVIVNALKGQLDQTKTNYDFNRDGNINATDLGSISKVFTTNPIYTCPASQTGHTWNNVQRLDSGTSTTVTATTLADTTKTWTVNQYAGKYVWTGSVYALITSNTATTLTFAAWSGATPATGAYTIDQ